MKPMTSRQRVSAALRREPVDQTPVCNPTSVATVELMDLVDAYFPEANVLVPLDSVAKGSITPTSKWVEVSINPHKH